MKKIILLLLISIFSAFPGCKDTRLTSEKITEGFVTGAFHGPSPKHFTDENFKIMKEAGLDLLIFWNIHSGRHNLKLLDMAHKFDMKVIPIDKKLYEMVSNKNISLNESIVKEAVFQYKGHPALAAYGLKDEPNAELFERIATVKKWIKKYDPQTPIFVNLFPSYATGQQLGTTPSDELGTSSYYEYVKKYVQTVRPSILCYDHYPLWEKNVVNPGWYDDLEINRELSQKADIPFWLFIQSEGLHGFMRVPNQQEIYWQAFSAMAYGAKGILWFTYWNPPAPPSDLPEDAPALAKQVHHHAMLDTNGNKNDMYYYVQNANKTVKNWANRLNGWENVSFARFVDGKLISGKIEAALNIEKGNFDILIGIFTKKSHKIFLLVNDNIKMKTEIIMNPAKILKTHNSKISEQPNTQKITITLNPGGAVLLKFKKPFYNPFAAYYPQRN